MHLESLDLHGYILADAILVVVRRYNRLLSSGAAGAEMYALEIVHGKGRGDTGSVIRDTLREYLREHGKRISGWDAKLTMRGAHDALEKCGILGYIHGEDIDGNSGKTVVIPRRPLGSPHPWLKYRA
ncbi:MAG TPA: Smr/MutS family protein [Chloroflexia bacterium]|nr:Smr/MutS family protein [Chloroflexia bacterium]